MRPSVLVCLILVMPACGSGGDDDDDDDDLVADAAPNQPDADPDRPDALPADCAFDDSEYSLLAEILQLESAGGGTCVRLTRRNDCQDICLAHPFTLLTFRVVHDGDSVAVLDQDQLHWEATHHNWNDWAEATTPTTRYRLEFRFGNGETDAYELTAFDGDTPIWGPVELLPHVP